jgi:hypothetical protein
VKNNAFPSKSHLKIFLFLFSYPPKNPEKSIFNYLALFLFLLPPEGLSTNILTYHNINVKRREDFFVPYPFTFFTPEKIEEAG